MKHPSRLAIAYLHIRRCRPNWPAVRAYADARIAVALPRESIHRALLLCYRECLLLLD